MKILDIKPLENNSKFPFQLLSRGIQDDALCDTVHFEISISPSPADYVNYFYRLLWERVYIKSTKPSNDFSHNSDKNIKINISLSEAMGFIYEATPPLLRNSISDIKSESDVVDALKVFLMEDNNNEQVHYIDIFKNHIRFKVFETVESIDVKAMDMLNKSRYGFVVRILDSTKPITSLIPKNENESLPSEFNTLCMFKSTGPDDLHKIKEILCTDEAKVSNVSIKNGNVYVRCSMEFNQRTFCRYMSESLKDCYSNII